jgi:hypothetical protein
LTPSHFQKVTAELDASLKKLHWEIADRGEDNFDPFLFAQALTLKLRVAFQLIGKQLLEQSADAEGERETA